MVARTHARTHTRLTNSLERSAIFSAAEGTVQVGHSYHVYIPVRASELQTAGITRLGSSQGRAESCKAIAVQSQSMAVIH